MLPLFAVAVAAAAAAMGVVAGSGAGASAGGPDAVAIAAGMAEGVTGWRGQPGVCYPNWMQVGDARGEASLVEALPAEAGPSQGVMALVGYPWVDGAGDGLEVEHPPGRAAALVGVSCQEGVLALPVGVLGAARLGAYLLMDR